MPPPNIVRVSINHMLHTLLHTIFSICTSMFLTCLHTVFYSLSGLKCYTSEDGYIFVLSNS